VSQFKVSEPLVVRPTKRERSEMYRETKIVEGTEKGVCVERGNTRRM